MSPDPQLPGLVSCAAIRWLQFGQLCSAGNDTSGQLCSVRELQSAREAMFCALADHAAQHNCQLRLHS